MLDQSFSVDNFRRILDYENRKGIFLEGKYFEDVLKITENIKRYNTVIKESKKILNESQFEEYRKVVNEKIDKLKQEKEDKLNHELQNVSENILNSAFKINLKKNNSISNKFIYTIEDSPENFFALKQIQYNFRKLYKVKQSNRYAIISHLKGLLDDSFPKYVIRTDIEDFYESLPHKSILEKFNEENLLTFYSKKIIYQILNEYKKISGSTTGVPRGIGISAYLSELYMRDLDNHIKSLPNVSYYARYVDDIIIIITPTSFDKNNDYLESIDKIIEGKFFLKRNQSKTQEFDLRNGATSSQLDYLGYRICFGNGTPIDIKLSKTKIEKYKNRINLIFSCYLYRLKYNEKKERKILIKRLRFITGNTRLLNNKKNILTGVYYSNSLLSSSSDFCGLDKYLTYIIKTSILSSHLKSRLSNYKFEEGFNNKKFSSFTTKELSEIVSVWSKR
jgi:hypothetical protein